MEYSMEGEVSNVTTLTLDTSLSLEGASAEAKATGDAIREAESRTEEKIQQHDQKKDNPHNVTAQQVGLGNVNNTSDMDKPVSTLQREAINEAKASGDAAQRTANDAKSIAQAALPKTGGAMTGDVDMASHKLTNLPAPDSDNDPATKKFVEDHVADYVAKKIGESTDGKHLFFSVFLNSASWVGTASNWNQTTAPYTQTVDVEGILETDKPHYAPVYTNDIATNRLERKAWGLVCDAETSDGKITFTCFDEKPATGINVMIEVNRA